MSALDVLCMLLFVHLHYVTFCFVAWSHTFVAWF